MQTNNCIKYVCMCVCLCVVSTQSQWALHFHVSFIFNWLKQESRHRCRTIISYIYADDFLIWHIELWLARWCLLSRYPPHAQTVSFQILSRHSLIHLFLNQWHRISLNKFHARHWIYLVITHHKLCAICYHHFF